ncbi:hypothetical protein G5C66_08055 [Nocardioides sp. KC13]|uniref:Aldolase n=1 Tax=Nocardioides turkmenicus TaxID=2711220 RepID=A0A6M1R4W6_9ACTN|nr:hypothetical protein [Nocardioides sp. KC13]NGN92688.1 hypothetical protein [Nocardioides sp. KC13]
MTNFWLAIDHADDALFRAPDSADIRPELLDLVADTPGWGIVVRPTQGHGGVRRGLACAGLPDIDTVEDLVVPERSTDAVKVGFDDHQGGCASTALAILDRLPGYERVFLEPYCTTPGCLDDLAALGARSRCGGIVLKLKVSDEGLAAIESAEFGGAPWVARSDGMGWDDFSDRLPRIRALGAGGVMVGRAVWGDTGEAGQDVRLKTVRERMHTIERIFG